MTEVIEDVQNTTETGSPPERRILNAASARSLYDRTLKNFEQTAIGRATIQGLLDGNAPYNPSKLKRLGQSWRCNVNFREGEAIVDANLAAYWELLMEVPTFINCDVDIDPKAQQPSVDYSEIIAEEYTRLLKRWQLFYYEILILAAEFLKYGVSLAYWPDLYDWKFESSKSASVLFPATTKSAVGKFKLVFIRGELEIQEIYEKIEDADSTEASKDMGWNPDAMKMALIKFYHRGDKDLDKKYQLSEWEDVQQKIKNNDWSTDEEDLQGIRVVYVFMREASGKVSQSIILEDKPLTLVSKKVGDEEYIFDHKEMYEDFSKVMAPFFYEVGDGYAKSVKGLGHRIYPHTELSNRFICTTIDGGIIASSLILKRGLVPGSAPDADARLLRIGPVTVLPDGYDPIQTSFSPPVQNTVAVRSMLQQILNNNVGAQRVRSEDPNNPEKTARQVMSEEQKETRFERNKISFFYVQEDALHQEIFRRLTIKDYPESADGYDERERFIKRCVDRGVPRELLDPDKCYVTSSRAIGLGSPALKSMVTSEVLNMAPLFDERGKRNAVRDWLAPRVGYSNVDRYAPIQNRNQIPTSEHSLAALESNDLSEGKPVTVGVDQPHIIHLEQQTPPLIEIVKIFNEQPQALDPVLAATYLNTGLPHISMHIQLALQNPSTKAEAQQYEKIIPELVKALKGLSALVEQQQKLQAEEQQRRATDQSPEVIKAQGEAQAKIIKANGEVEIERAKQDSIQKMREQKTVHKITLDNAESAAEQSRKDRESAAEENE